MKTITTIFFLACGFATFAYAAETAAPAAAAVKSSALPAKAQPAPSEPPLADADITSTVVVARLSGWDNKLDTVQFSFDQMITFGDSGITSKIAGRLQYAKPNKLRIEHTAPQRQVVYTDKNIIWIYKPADAQVVKARWSDWLKQQSGALSGITDFGAYSNLMESHTVTVSVPKGGKTVEATLTPNKDPKSYELKLVLSRKDFFPERAILKIGGTTVDTKIIGAEKNGKIAPETFEFKAPKGVDILELDGKPRH